jgi:methionyl-tRNA formyltransferase
MAKKRKIPVITTRDINTAGGYKFLAALSPDLVISAFFDQKFEAGLCDGVTYSVINIHPSFLPENKGVDPVFHAVLNGANQAGVTLHRVTEKFDSGAIIAQKQLPRDSSGSVLFTYRELMAAGMDLLLSSKHLLLDRSATIPQQEAGSYQSWPSAKEVRALYRKGYSLMRWRDVGSVSDG